MPIIQNIPLAIALNVDDLNYFLNLAKKRSIALNIYFISPDGFLDAKPKHIDGVGVFTFSDFWSEYSSRNIDFAGLNTIKIVELIHSNIANDESISAYKVASILAKFSSQQLWPFLRCKEELNFILEKFCPNTIFYRGSKSPFVKAFGSGNDVFSSVIGYLPFYRYHLHELADKYNILIEFHKATIKDKAKSFFSCFLLDKCIFVYKYLVLVRAYLRALFNHNNEELKETKYTNLFVSQSTVHEGKFAQLKVAGKTLSLIDYSLNMQKKKIDISYDSIMLKNCIGLTDFRFQSDISILDKALGKVHEPGVTELLKNFYFVYPEFDVTYHALVRFIEKVSPQYIYFGNDQVPSSALIARYCSNKNIHSSTIQHGWIAAPPVNNVPLLSDEFIYFNRYTRDILEKYVQAGRLKFNRNLISVSNIAPTNKETFDTFILVIQGYKPYKKRALALFLALALQFPKYRFIVRLSPREDTKKFSSNLNNVIFDNTYSVNELFDLNAIVIGFNSTMLYEAMLYGRPVFTVDMPFETINPFITKWNVLPFDSEWADRFSSFLIDFKFQEKLMSEQSDLLSNFIN